MCMHILEPLNSIVYLAQSWCVGGGLRLEDWFGDNISMAKSQSAISILILSNRGTFFVFQKNCYNIMAFSSHKIKQAMIA